MRANEPSALNGTFVWKRFSLASTLIAAHMPSPRPSPFGKFVDLTLDPDSAVSNEAATLTASIPAERSKLRRPDQPSQSPVCKQRARPLSYQRCQRTASMKDSAMILRTEDCDRDVFSRLEPRHTRLSALL